jgi:uncharacterized membrane protein
VRRFAQSYGYLRFRALLGSLYAILGVVLLVRTFGAFGLRFTEIPAVVLGLALIALGSLRVRDYLTRRPGQTP